MTRRKAVISGLNKSSMHINLLVVVEKLMSVAPADQSIRLRRLNPDICITHEKFGLKTQLLEDPLVLTQLAKLRVHKRMATRLNIVKPSVLG